jgi:serine/threonine protein kinase, bacterial
MYFISDQASNPVVALPAIDADALNQPLAPPASIGRLSLPLGLFFDGSRRLHIADSANGRIVTWALETGAWSTFGAGALRRPLDVVVDAKNRIYVVDGQRILRVDAEDGSGAVVLSGLTANQRPIAIAVDITGRIFIIDSRTRGLWFTDDEGGSWQPLGFPEGEVPSKPVSVAARHDGGVLVTDLGNRRRSARAVAPASRIVS